MAQRWRSSYAGILAVAVLAGGAVFGARQFLASRRPQPVYRIGYGNDVPFQFKDAGGAATGIAVEIVREAARRRGIRLQWTEPVNAGIGSILSGEDDLWVLLTVRPERRGQIYITEPYLTMERCFLVRKGGTIHAQSDLTQARIAFRESWSKQVPPPASQAAYPNADELYLKEEFPAATRVATVYNQIGDLLQAVAEGRADAALLNKNVVAALLLTDRDPSQFELVSAPHAVSELALGSSFAARRAAGGIRDEIQTMAEDGAIPQIAQRWGFFQSVNLEIINRLAAARRASRFLAAGVAALALALAFIGLLALRLRRQRNTVRATQAALRQSETYYRSLVELLPDTIYSMDAEGRLLRGSSATGLPLLQLLEQSPNHRRNVAAACRQGRAIEGEEQTPDGRIFEYRLIPAEARAAEPAHAIGILREVTNSRAAEQQRLRLLEEREEASRLESLGRLAGGVAHDFNNILTVINGHSDLLLRKLSGRADLQSDVSEIRTAGATAATLTEQLLAFSQKRSVQPRVLDLNTVIRRSAGMLEKLAGSEVVLHFDLASDLRPVNATVGGFQQVLINLTVNARDAMPGGGSLWIRTTNTAGTATPGVLLTVQDTGEGIPKDVAGRIFEPFFTTKAEGKGTGLGLATVYGIVKQLGGSISVESEVGHGAARPVPDCGLCCHGCSACCCSPPILCSRRCTCP